MQILNALTEHINLIIKRFPSELLEEPIKLTDLQNGIIIKTMEEEPIIITALYASAAEYDLDIMEFSMHSKMIQDEDENFITTLTFLFHDIQN